MNEKELDTLREKTRQLCAERSLGIVPYGSAWWIVGDGVSLVVADLAGVCAKDLEPLHVVER